MCGRNAIGCMRVLALLLVSGLVGCQMSPGNSTALDELANNVKKLTDQMATKQELAAAEGTNAVAHHQLTDARRPADSESRAGHCPGVGKAHRRPERAASALDKNRGGACGQLRPAHARISKKPATIPATTILP